MPVPANGLSYSEIYRTETDVGDHDVAVSNLLASVTIDPCDSGCDVCVLQIGPADTTKGMIRARRIDGDTGTAVSVQRADDTTNGVTHFCAVSANSLDNDLPPASDE